MNDKNEIRKADTKARRKIAKADKHALRYGWTSRRHYLNAASTFEFYFGPTISEFMIRSHSDGYAEANNKNKKRNDSKANKQLFDDSQSHTDCTIHNLKVYIAYGYMYILYTTLAVTLLTAASIICNLWGTNIFISYEYMGVIAITHLVLFLSRYSGKVEWFAVWICVIILYYFNFLVLSSIICGVSELANII